MRILVVDDTEPLRFLLCRYLGALGHEVTTVGSGLDVPAQLAGAPFDAVLTDVAMPDCSGWDVLKVTRAARPGVPVILMTGWADAHGRGLEGLAPDAVLDKPFTLEQIRDVLEAVRR